MKKMTSKQLCLCGLFAALMCVCAWISINIFSIPVTLQLLAVLICAALLTPGLATMSVVAYVLLGLVGLPVFAGFTGGVGKLFGITGGYIIGFIPAVYVTSLLVHKCHFGKQESTALKLVRYIVAMVLGVLVCYAFGTVWFMIINQQSVAAHNAEIATMTDLMQQEAGGVKSAYTLGQVLGICVLPYLPFDAVKIALAAVLSLRLEKAVKL
jgi:biotin transport system substrate-specific component